MEVEAAAVDIMSKVVVTMAAMVVVVIMLIISMGITRKAITKEILERG